MVALGAIGIAIGRLATSPVPGVVMAVAIYALALASLGDASWQMPLPPRTDAGHSYVESALTLHLVFLAGVTGLAAATAIIIITTRPT